MASSHQGSWREQQAASSMEAQLAQLHDLSSALEHENLPRWWLGPLNVEKLACSSVQLVADALHRLSGGVLDARSGTDQIPAAFDSLSALTVNGQRSRGFAELSSFFPTGEGWLRTHANYPHHRHALLRAFGADDLQSLSRSLLDASALEAEDRIIAAGGIAGAVRTRDQWDQQAASLLGDPRPWADFSVHPHQRPNVWRYDPEADLPLAGFRVLDLTRVVAGPTATRILAALGAQVLRIDPPAIDELQNQHLDTGFGKYSAKLDLRDDTQYKRLLALLKDADALILGYRPGALASLGLEVEALKERFPGLIIVQLRAWEAGGVWAERRGFDSIVQAVTGIADVYRSADGRPGTLPVQALDHASGYGMAAAVISLAQVRSDSGFTGSVQFCLERTAKALFALEEPQGSSSNLPVPRTGNTEGSYGRLSYVLPPLKLNGSMLDYPFGPRRYGGDDARWV